MNVIVANENKSLLSSLDIDVIKSIDGVFSVDEIINTFDGFFFNKMFLDITAIKDNTNYSNIQKLSIGLDMSKVILLLTTQLYNNKGFISKLISFGIYNFARDKDSLFVNSLYGGNLNKSVDTLVSEATTNVEFLIDFIPQLKELKEKCESVHSLITDEDTAK